MALDDFIKRANDLIFKSAEGVGKLFEPKNIGKAFQGLRGGIQRGGAGVNSAFKGIGSRIQSGVYHTAEGIGKAFEDPKGTASNLMNGLRNRTQGKSYNWQRHFAQQNQGLQGFTPLQRAGRAMARYAGNATRGIGGLFGGAVGRGASVVGAGAAGLAGLGMAGAGKVGGLAAAPFKAVAGLFSKIGSPASGVAKSIGLFAKLAGPAGLVATLFGLKKFTELLSDSNRDLAKWNGGLAASFAKLDIQKMRLDIQTANATSGTAVGLNDAFGELLTEFQPIREDLANLANVVGIGVANGTKNLIQIARGIAATEPLIKDMLDTLHAFFGEFKKDDQETFPGTQALKNLTAMGGIGPRQLDAPPRPFLNDGIAPALTPAERLRQRRLMMRGE